VKEYPQSTGADTLLVSAVQTRNNARVVFSGSTDLFGNQFAVSGVDAAGKKFAKSGNAEFVSELTEWLFHKRGHLRVKAFRHRRADDSFAAANPKTYRVKDDIVRAPPPLRPPPPSRPPLACQFPPPHALSVCAVCLSRAVYAIVTPLPFADRRISRRAIAHPMRCDAMRRLRSDTIRHDPTRDVNFDALRSASASLSSTGPRDAVMMTPVMMMMVTVMVTMAMTMADDNQWR
jgi:hypothetical protein